MPLVTTAASVATARWAFDLVFIVFHLAAGAAGPTQLAPPNQRGKRQAFFES